MQEKQSWSAPSALGQTQSLKSPGTTSQAPVSLHTFRVACELCKSKLWAVSCQAEQLWLFVNNGRMLCDRLPVLEK